MCCELYLAHAAGAGEGEYFRVYEACADAGVYEWCGELQLTESTGHCEDENLTGKNERRERGPGRTEEPSPCRPEYSLQPRLSSEQCEALCTQQPHRPGCAANPVDGAPVNMPDISIQKCQLAQTQIEQMNSNKREGGRSGVLRQRSIGHFTEFQQVSMFAAISGVLLECVALHPSEMATSV